MRRDPRGARLPQTAYYFKPPTTYDKRPIGTGRGRRCGSPGGQRAVGPLEPPPTMAAGVSRKLRQLKEWPAAVLKANV